MAWTVQAQSVIYVKSGSQGNGQSWANAMGDLQQALQVAKKGQQIWVAKGTYYPTTGTDRQASFQITDGVQLFGGFIGTEQSPKERDLTQNQSILSGHIGSASINDNSYNVIRTAGVSPQTVVDGFVITGGNANRAAVVGNREGCGGAWYNDGAMGKTSSPTIRNCVFNGNQAHYGGALFNNGSEGICVVNIENCTFIQNIASSNGGAIYNSGINGSCNIKIATTHFIKNQASYGAGIQNRADAGVASPMVRNCTFRENVAYLSGSGVYNYRSPEGTCRPVLSGCIFENNKDGLGETVSKPVGGHAASKGKRSSSIIMRPTY
jgi:predicted outer membrane repeat protein